MRLITMDAVDAFMKGESFRRDNTTVTRDGRFYLWGHLIAEKLNEMQIKVSDCGYNTMTTYERLHGIISKWTRNGYGCAKRKGGVLLNNHKFGSKEWESPFQNGMIINRE